MNIKKLWKIESLWEQYFSENDKSRYFDLENMYEDGFSFYNDDFQIVNEFDFTPSPYPVHEDDQGSYLGLKKSQCLKTETRWVYVFDNHNKILQAFLEYAKSVQQSFDVVHIDAHADDAKFEQEKPSKPSLLQVREYIQSTRISDFFDFLSESKIIHHLHRYVKSSDFVKFKKPHKPYILSLDIDIFGPEGDFVPLEDRVRCIAEAWRYAEVVCIATSPGFIDQEFAFELIKIFTKKAKK